LIYYTGAIILAVILELLSNRLPQSDPLKDFFHDAAIAIPIAVAGLLVAALTRYILDSHGEEKSKLSKITYLWQELGLLNMAKDWREFREHTQIGLLFRDRLKKYDKDATWYIVTISPEAFVGEFFQTVIIPAIEQNVKVKWSYVRLPEVDEGETGKTLRDWATSKFSEWTPNIEKLLEFAQNSLKNHIGEMTRIIEQRIELGTIDPKNFELYESSLPTMFLALIAISDKPKATARFMQLKSVEKGIALIYPYTMFPVPDQDEWGMLLSSPGKLYEQYKESTIRFFSEGLTRGHLVKVWPKS